MATAPGGNASLSGGDNTTGGSNVLGNDLTLDAGASTGSSVPRNFHVRASVAGASGTTLQTEVDRFTSFNKTGLTSGGSKNLVSVAIAVDQGFGLKLSYTIFATDTTNHHSCSLTGDVFFSGENTAGVFVISTPALSPAVGLPACDGANTITAAWVASGANPSVISVTPTVSGFTATTITAVGIITNSSLQQITLL
jgi:hypothetical protein